MGAVKLDDPLSVEILLQLMIHHVGGEHQGDFAQLGELSLELRRDRLRTAIHPPASDSHNTRARRRPVRSHPPSDEGLGYGLLHFLSANRLDLTLLLLDELEIDRGNHGDSRREKLFHVLPAVGVSTAARIIVGESVDQANRRPPPKNRLDIDRGAAQVLTRRDGLEAL